MARPKREKGIKSILTISAIFLLGSIFQVNADTCTAGTPLTGGTQHCSSNASGTVNGFSWMVWSSGSGGCITPYGVGAAFNATWDNSGDFLAREGLGWNSTETYSQIGPISADFAYTKTGTAGGFSYIGVYGWSVNPIHEYYIVEDWFGSGTPTGFGTLMGTFTIDSGTYKVYQHTQSDQPAITGRDTTFVQFFSIRQTARQCGHISISGHFKKWDSLGLTLGKMEEARLLVEAGGGTGSIDFTRGAVAVGVTSVLPVPEYSPGRNAFLENSKGSGVLSIISLNGTVVRSIRQQGPGPAVISTDNLAKGVYVLQFLGDGKAPITRPLLILR